MPGAPCRKAYVAVNLDVDEEGNLYPRAIRWRDGRVFVIERLKYKCRAASAKVGGGGITRLLSAERSLFFFMKAINGSSRQRRDMDDFVTRTD